MRHRRCLNEGRAVAAPLEATMNLATILLPLDGSLLAESAIPTAIDVMMGHPEATLVLLRAAKAVTVPGTNATDAEVAVVREAETYLATVAAWLRTRGVTHVKTSVWYGAAPTAIIEAARVDGADLIIMSTHARSGIGRFVLGSATETVLRGASTPVLIVPPESAPLERLFAIARPRPAEVSHV